MSLKTSLQKNDFIKGIFGVIAGAVLASVSGYYISNQAISFTVNIMIAFLIIQIIMRSDLKTVTITYTYSLTILYTIQLLIMIIFQVFRGALEYTFSNGLIVQMLTTITVMIILKLLPISRFYTSLIGKNKWMGIVVTNIFIVHYVLVILWYTNLNGFLNSMLGVLILVVIILLINTLMITHGVSNQILSEKMKMYDMYFPVIENIIEEVRIKQHDYHNHIQALNALNSVNHTTDEFKQYLKNIRTNDIWTNLIRLDNKVLMAFLYSKYTYAQKINVNINFQIHNYLFKSEIQDYDLIEIFGILIDNSIEATLEVDAKECELLMNYEDGMNIIQTRNKASTMSNDELIKKLKKERRGDIKGKHGYGLRKLSDIINNNKGDIIVRFDTEDQEVIFRVEIPESLE
jgi:hypothetical protein